MIKCLNCSTEFKGSFCWNCGQKASVGRLHIREILKEIFLSPFHIHPHGLLYTFLWLFKRPGQVIRQYIIGQRKLLHPAFRYLVLAGTLATIVMTVYEPFKTEHIPELPFEFISGEFFVWVSGHITLINLIAVPVFALGTYVFFRPLKFNYAENLALQAYIASQQLWILVILFPFFHFLPELNQYINSIYSVATVVYNLVVVMSFFKMLSVTGFMLSLLAFLYSYVLQFIVTYLYFLGFGGITLSGH